MTEDQRFERPTRVVALVVLVAAAALLAGCSALQPADDPTATPPTGPEATAQYEDVSSISIVLNTTRQHEGNRSWTVQEIATRPETGAFRNVVRSTGPASADERGSLPPGSRVVSNGSVRYIYPANGDRVFRSDVSDESRNRSEQIRQLLAALDDESGPIRHPDLGLSPLPIVPAASGSAATENESTRWHDTRVTVEYRGRETVTGRTTYVVHLQPVGDNASLVEATLWLDAEYLYPLKRHTVFERRGDRYEFTSVPQNVTFNPDLPAGTFSFEPESVSDDVSVVETASYDSYSEMTADLDRSLPDPDVPRGFEFESGYRSGGERSRVSFTYTDGRQASIRVSVSGESGSLTGGRQEAIRGQEVVISTYEKRRFLVWNSDEQRYSVSGTVENQTLRRVAASIIEDQ
jgi:outer membrane lipoprotein-sorting protein